MRKFLFLLLMLPLVLGLGACSGLDIVNAGVSDDSYRLTQGIVYADGARHSLDVYQPVNPTLNHPVVLFIYGGDWRWGSKEDYRFAGEALASRGIMAVIADYRLYPQVRYPAMVEDAASALRWTHDNIARYGGNSERVFVAGHSAGAYNALMLAMDPTYVEQAGGHLSWIRGAIGLAGPYDFLPLDSDTVQIFGHVPDPRQTQPVTFANGIRPPVLLLHGTDDDTVRVKNSRSLAAHLQAVGSPVLEKEYAGKGHVDLVLALANHFRYIAPVLDDIDAFVTERSK